MDALAPRTLPRRADLRWFGVILAAFFGGVGAVVWWAGAGGAARALWGIGAGLAASYYLLPPLRLPLYLVWMRVVHPLGWVVTRLLFAVVYYGLVLPSGLAARLLGRDRLQLRRDPPRDSYWSAREPGGDLDRYFRQT